VNLEEVVLADTGEEGKMCIERVREHEVLRLRGKLLPLVRLADLLGIPRTFVHPETGERMTDRRKRLADRRSAPLGDYDAHQQQMDDEGRQKEDRRHPQNFTIMVVKVGFNRYGIIVEAVEDTQEIVVKPLSSFIKQIPTFSGATILGDGTVCMILDVPRMANYANLRYANMLPEIQSVQRKIEGQFLAVQPAVEKEAVELLDRDAARARAFLTDYSVSHGELVVARWRQLGEHLVQKYNDGYVQDEDGRPHTASAASIRTSGCRLLTATKVTGRSNPVCIL
jgi:chemotaxis signal transduction protein